MLNHKLANKSKKEHILHVRTMYLLRYITLIIGVLRKFMIYHLSQTCNLHELLPFLKFSIANIKLGCYNNLFPNDNWVVEIDLFSYHAFLVLQEL